ncbi:MAG: ribonuclease P protein component [Patescibacteria group bacterium]|jgi:ribonuclease P protein component
MLSKKFRLTRKRINIIYKKGSSKKFGVFGIKLLKNNSGVPRFSIVIPQKVVKKAVARNRIRRVIFSVIEQVLKTDSLPSVDYIIRLYKETDEKSIKEQILELKNV